MDKSTQNLIVILGPTASGKTELALKLAKKFNGEIISADSRQIYKEMDIGTAKPFFCHCEVAKGDRSNLIIPHHLIDIVRPDQDFTLSQYQKLAVKTIKGIQKRGKIPFLVGGTGLYIKSIVDNLKIPQVKPDKNLRRKLEKLSEEQLLLKLQKLDPLALEFVDPKNKRRLIRALEVCLLTKKPFSRQREKGEELFNVLQIGLKIGKEEIKKRIEQRTEKMIEMGLIDEVKNLLKKYSPDLPSMSGIGYQEIIQYLNKKSLLPERTKRFLLPERAERVKGLFQAEQLIAQRTYQYAKRQMTWFKKDKRIKWINNYREAEKLIREFLEKKNPDSD